MRRQLISSTGTLSSNKLQRLACMTGYQNNSTSNGCQDDSDISYCNIKFPRVSASTWQPYLANSHIPRTAMKQYTTDSGQNQTWNIHLWHQPSITGLNSLGPSDAIWWHRSGSTLVQAMAWCRLAPSHYLNQCWLITDEFISEEFNKKC